MTKQSKTVIYLDGRFIAVNPAMLAIFTPGNFDAKGVFETMRAIGQYVFDINPHLERLRRGLTQLKIPTPIISAAIIRRVVKVNGFETARVRVVVWQEGGQTHRSVMALPYALPTQRRWRVCLVKTDRPANARFACVKSLDYKVFADAFANAKAQGFDDAILLNRQGNIMEASRANLFVMKDGILVTPPLSSGCLDGITRRAVIAQAKRLKIPFQEKQLSPAALANADFAFVTNSLIGIMPIDQRVLKQ